MNENSMEELKQRLEELYKTQQARLDAGADDLDIREAIAEVEEQIKELQDETSDEADIKEDIEVLEEMSRLFKNVDERTLYVSSVKARCKQRYQAIDTLLSEYKRVLKENEELKEYIAIAPNLDEMTATKYRNIQRDAYIRGRAEEQQKAKQRIYENYIHKQKIKDKIEELSKIKGDFATYIATSERIKALSELLESEKKE